MSEERPAASLDFVRQIVATDVAAGKHDGRVMTRFPPEPNGYLHVGHAKSICLNFGIAAEFGGLCNLRFDDTNPAKEGEEYVEAIKRDVRWLGFDWEDRLYFASDYYEKLHAYAIVLIEAGKAYVCSLSSDEIREYRGTLTEPGRDSPYRDRTVEENLDLFARMRDGEFDPGAHVLRAKIDMASKNIIMRDPTIYRIVKAHHHRTGDRWCIYPMYDFAHGLSDAIEGVTHSICTLEFENNRPLYDWFLDQLPVPSRPQQIEFARLNLTHTLTSKRKLLELVTEGHVTGWDDPRMPTLSGMRRRGYTPAAIRTFCDRIGVAKSDSMVEFALLEHCLREDLNRRSPRVMGVLMPVRLVIENYPDTIVEEFEALNNPEDPEAGTRRVTFSKTLYIERDDFEVDPPPKFFRLSPGREVRLRSAYLVTCTGYTTDDETGEITEVRCTYDPNTRGGSAPDGRRVKGTIHWVSAEHSLPAEVRLYEQLFTTDDPGGAGDFREVMNPASLVVLEARVEPSLAGAKPGYRCQFERQGYFCVDPDADSGSLVFNRTVTLRDTWAKIRQAGSEG
jgi:glutaminyl-tRNA synthetase